jgi:hypothetical protein
VSSCGELGLIKVFGSCHDEDFFELSSFVKKNLHRATRNRLLFNLGGILFMFSPLHKGELERIMLPFEGLQRLCIFD